MMKEKLLTIINSIQQNKDCDVLVDISFDSRLREDLNFDSFDLAELTVKLEEEFAVDIFEDGLVSTVGEIFSKLKL